MRLSLIYSLRYKFGVNVAVRISIEKHKSTKIVTFFLNIDARHNNIFCNHVDEYYFLTVAVCGTHTIETNLYNEKREYARNR